MIFTAMQPLIVATVTLPFYKVVRIIDKNLIRVRSGTLTAMPTVDAYIELHAGPQFVLDHRIAALLLQVSVALIFGMVLPVLYPIVFVGLLAQNILDRLLLCYFYREPPHYDEKSVLLALKILKIVGIVSLFHNFWILTNR